MESRCAMHNLLPISVFLVIAFFLTYNVLNSSGLVIGDNFYWSKPTIFDILGPRVLRESFLGDVAVLSTFKNGFLFPMAWFFNEINVPITLIYPYLFYFLSMLSFYYLSIEFLKKRLSCIIVSVMYLINPVNPYYFASLLSAFVIVFLPLILKYFIRTLRQINQQSTPSFSGNFGLCAIFLALSISAHEQFLPLSVIIAVFLVFTFVAVCYQNYGLTSEFAKTTALNILLFTGISFLVNLPLLLSLGNIFSTPLATYFTGRFYDFLGNVEYTYSTTNLITLLRFGGDSGVGLGQNSWFDSFAYTNLFGYAIFAVSLISAFLLVRRKNKVVVDNAFFSMNLLMFISTIALILFVKYLPTNKVLAEKLFSLPLQTFESPSKLRVLLFLSGLVSSLFVFQKLEEHNETKRGKFVVGTLLILLTVSVVIYNSPWVIYYAGYTPLKQIADSLNWGDLYDKQYSNLSVLIEKNYAGERGIMIPYTHKAELYLPPNFRIFQLVSSVNEQIAKLTAGSSTSWSKLVGLLSAKYLIINENYDTNELLLFPRSYDNDITSILKDIESDTGLTFQGYLENCTVFKNENALPKIYASKYYVLYDDIDTLKFAIGLINFKDLPVFIASEKQTNRLVIPQFISNATYDVNALSLPSTSAANLTLVVTNGNNLSHLYLNRTGTFSMVDVFSASCRLSPGDIISLPDSDIWSIAQEINELILDSSSFTLGNYGSFALNFTVSLLQRGGYNFLGPSVIIDVGNSTKYFLIFHDSGVAELAVMREGIFTDGVIVQTSACGLKNEHSSINVDIRRIFDEIDVWINDELALSFTIGTNVATIILSSEGSMSKFTSLDLRTRNIVRLFASRHFSNQPGFFLKQDGPDKSVLEVANSDSDFAVVVQYLNTPLRNIESRIESNAFQANVFFSGWILSQKNPSSEEEILAMGVANLQLALGLTIVSIFFTWSILTVEVVGWWRKKPISFFFIFLNRLRHIAKRRDPAAIV